MEKRPKIGVIGAGYVGNAVYNGFSLKADIKLYDIKPELASSSFEDTINSDFIYICLPTPMKGVEGGEIDLSIIESVLKEIDKKVKGKTIVVKSSVVPGTTEKFAEKYKNNYFIANPEFLTARTANLDFIQATRIVVGSTKNTPMEIKEKFIDLQRMRFLVTPIVETDATTAEFIKYMSNCFLATKITYMNELHFLGKKFGVDWDAAVKGFLLDGRIGNSHYEVPGWDGGFGFGGACFPKDINALIYKAGELGFDTKLLRAAWEQNKKFRNKKDWNWAKNSSAVTNHNPKKQNRKL